MKTLRTDWQAVNAHGVVLYSFNDFEIGRDWVKRNAALHDGLELREVALVSRRVYRPRVARPAPVSDFAIPAVAS